ncbi:hypothetical protein CP533_4799 [Ophiocordyceps camponoti-saundersi (nom. inval.)]|nr:hypothetical protein CP533_4799 [Ophiocordyceps camponoti-saundersi (nom. inval.)]
MRPLAFRLSLPLAIITTIIILISHGSLIEAVGDQDELDNDFIRPPNAKTYFLVTRRGFRDVRRLGIPALVQLATVPRMQYEAYQLSGEEHLGSVVIAHEDLLLAVLCFLERWVGAHLYKGTPFYVYEIQRTDAIRTPCPILGRGNRMSNGGHYVVDRWLQPADTRLIRWAPLPARVRRDGVHVVATGLSHLPWRGVNPIAPTAQMPPITSPEDLAGSAFTRIPMPRLPSASRYVSPQLIAGPHQTRLPISTSPFLSRQPTCFDVRQAAARRTLAQHSIDHILRDLQGQADAVAPIIRLTDGEINNPERTLYTLQEEDGGGQGTSLGLPREDAPRTTTLEPPQDEPRPGTSSGSTREEADTACDAAQSRAAQQRLTTLLSTAGNDVDVLFEDAEAVMSRILWQQMNSAACFPAFMNFNGFTKRSAVVDDGGAMEGNCCQLLKLVEERLKSHACAKFSELRFRLKLSSSTFAGGTYDDIMLKIGNETMTLAEHPSKYFDEERFVDLRAAFGSAEVLVRDIQSFVVYSLPDQRSIADEWTVESFTLTGQCAGSPRKAQVFISVNQDFSRFGDNGVKSQYTGAIDIDDWRWLSPDKQTRSVAVQPPGQPFACTELKSLKVNLRLGSGWWQGTWDKIYMEMGPGGNKVLLATSPSPGYDAWVKVDLKEVFGSPLVAVGSILAQPRLIRLLSVVAQDEWMSSSPDKWKLAGNPRKVRVDKFATVDQWCIRSPGEKSSEVFHGGGLRLEDWKWAGEGGDQ